MMRTPAQHQLDMMKRPGQVVNDVTLADYYARKMKTKQTFDEWWLVEARYFPMLSTADAEFIWKSAQDNM